MNDTDYILRRGFGAILIGCGLSISIHIAVSTNVALAPIAAALVSIGIALYRK